MCARARVYHVCKSDSSLNNFPKTIYRADWKVAAHATTAYIRYLYHPVAEKYENTFYRRNVIVYQKSGCRILEGTASGDGVSRDGVTPALSHGNLAVHYRRLISPTF